MDPACHPRLRGLVTDFVTTVPEVVRALVVSADGVPVAVSDGMQPSDLERLSVIASGMTGLAGGAARVLNCGAITQALVAMERGTLVIMAVGDGASLAVLTTGAADLEEVAYEMTVLAEQAAGALTPAARDTGSELRPLPPPQPLARRVPRTPAPNGS